jgi:hypothetical protein
MLTLDEVIASALRTFHQEISATGWCGREREMVSHFAFAHLSRHCTPNGPLQLAQIGIEVAVPQLDRDESHGGRKKAVCKDLVIWPTPAMTFWSPKGSIPNEPIVIMEWKAKYSIATTRRPQRKSAYDQSEDIEWLKMKCQKSDIVGYAVLADNRCAPFTLECWRFRRDKREQKFLSL